MNHDLPVREILLVINTSFAKRQLCERDTHTGYNHPDPAEQLAEACWNGLLNEMLPRTMRAPSCTVKLFCWQVEVKKSCLHICMGVCSPDMEMEFTLDPYLFLCVQKMN